MSLPNKTGPQK